MKSIEITLDNTQVCSDEIRLINFASEDIFSIDIKGNNLLLHVADEADQEQIKDAIFKILHTYKRADAESEILFLQNNPSKKYCTISDIFKSDLIQRIAPGMVILKKEALGIYDFFDNCFKQIVKSYNFEYRKMPVMLPINTYLDTNYLKTSPQYSIFCSFINESISSYENLPKKIENGQVTEELKVPCYALSPSACFHLYEELRNKRIPRGKIYTFRQNVFRNEGRLNWKESTRYLDYTVREIVFFGTKEEVYDIREKLLSKTIDILKKYNLISTIIVGADPFVIPEMQRYKDIQKRNRVKYELRINTADDKTTACASFNLHGTHFTKAFNISVENVENTYSGCIGFGLERWVYCFLAQYGTDLKNWPYEIQRYITEKY